jgi:hypothetical protein
VFSAVTLDRALSCEMEMKFHLPERAERESARGPYGPKGVFCRSRKWMNLMAEKSAPQMVSPVYLVSIVPPITWWL